MARRCRGWISKLASIVIVLGAAAATAEAQAISLASGKSFHQGDAPTSCPQITIFCTAGVWNSTNDLRVIIPNTLNLVWDDTSTPSFGGGNAANMVGTFSFTNFNGPDNGFKTFKADVLNTFSSVQTLTISGLRFKNFGSPSTGFIGASNAGSDVITISDSNSMIIFQNPGVNSGSNQTVNPPGPVVANPITITDGGTNPGIKTGTGLRVTIPAGVNMTWRSSITTVGVAMTPVAPVRVQTTGVTYEDFNATLGGFMTASLVVLSDFVPGDSVQISGLQFNNIGDDSGPVNLRVTTNGPSGAGATGGQGVDIRTKDVFGRPTVSIPGNLAFSAGDPLTAAPIISVRSSPGNPTKIDATNNIKLILQGNMEWDQSIQHLGDGLSFGGGTGATHITAAAIKVSYPNAQTAQVELDTDFGTNELLTISGLKWMNFGGASPAQALVLNTGTAVVNSAQTLAIGAPTFVSQIPPPGQTFVRNADTTATAPAAAILISDDAQSPAINRITAAQGIRIRIPTLPSPPAVTLIWDPAVTTVTCTGNAQVANFMLGTAAVSYEDAGKTAVISVNGDWIGDSLNVTISGLVFKDFSNAMTSRKLGLGVNGSLLSGGTNTSLDVRNIAIGGFPGLASFNDQGFTFLDPPTNALQITVTEASDVPGILATKDIRIVIPNTFPMVWNTAKRRRADGLVFGGSAALTRIAQLNGDVVITYPDSKTAVIDVTSDFAITETLSITGLQFQTFSGVNAPDNLLLFVDPLGAPVSDSKTIGIGRPTISLSVPVQTFGDSDPPTVVNPITVTDDPNVARIQQSIGIILRLPATATLAVDWNVNIKTALDGLSFTGNGSGHVVTVGDQVSYPDAKTAVINLQSDFAPGETLVINGLQGANFVGTTGPQGVRLEVNGQGTVCRTSTQGLATGSRPQLVSVRTGDTNGNGSIDTLVLTFNKVIDPNTSSVLTGAGFTITSPSYIIGAGSASGMVVTFDIVEKGTPDTGVRPLITYNPAIGNLQESGTALETSFTGPQVVADGAPPIVTGLTPTDSDGNGHLDTLVITFSEALKTLEEDIQDWKLIDADGTTNLLQGLTSSAILISGNTVRFTLSNVAGTAGTPHYFYTDSIINPRHLQDLFSNSVIPQTNNLAPVVRVGPNLAIGPSKVTLDASRSFDPNGQPLTFSWAQTGGSPTFTILNADTSSPSFLATTAGNYTFTVTVTNALQFATADVLVTIINVPPGADAGSNQSASPGTDPVFLVALGSSDANGDTLFFTWTQLSGAPVGGFTTVVGNDAVVSFAAPTPAVPPALPNNILTFQVAVSDGVNTTTATTQVRINGGTPLVPILAPTANAGPDQVARVDTQVTLDGSQSLNPAGGSLQYQWISTTPLTNPTSANPTFKPLLPGLYTFDLVVTNPGPGIGLSSAPSRVQVLVQPVGNQAPVAVAHRLLPSGEITVGNLVVLDATGSVDPEGTPLTYAWGQTAGPKVILENPSGLRTAFTPVAFATYTFQLIVSDGVNTSRPATVSLTVKGSPGDTTFSTSITYGSGIAVNGHAQLSTISVATPLTLDVATSDPGNSWFFYLDQTGGPALDSANFNQLVFGSPNTFSFVPTVAGYYTFRLSATSGPPLPGRTPGIRAFATIGVVVDDDTTPDLVPLANAGASQVVAAGTQVTLDARGSTDDNLVAIGAGLRPYWVQREGPPMVLSDPYAAQPSFTPTAPGQYTFELSVADTTASSAPSFVVVTVQGTSTGTVATSGGGGCGFLGLEGFLLLPLIWIVSLLRPRRRLART